MARVSPKNGPKIVVLGGGTGGFTTLSMLKDYSHSITVIVNMVDDGGSTGVLRDELGTLPSGDVRKCLVALSDSPKIQDLFNYRFEKGTFEGHALGNLLLGALEKTTGSFSEAVEIASEILHVNGKVVPATLDNVRLKMEWPTRKDSTLLGESIIDAGSFAYDPREAVMSLVPNPQANSAALEAINQADMVVISPGDLYTSLGPLLVIDGFRDALVSTKAITLYVANLVTKKGHTEGFSVADHADEIERFAGAEFLDYVLYNELLPSAEIAKRYEAEGAYLVDSDTKTLKKRHFASIGGNFLGEMAAPYLNDVLPVTRSLIRHDGLAVAQAIIQLYSDVSDANS